MFIYHSVHSLGKMYGEKGAARNVPQNKSAVGTQGARRDEVVLSSQAQSFSQVLEKAKNISEVRQDKVDAISARIDAGQYRIDTRILAEKMLNGRY